MPVSRPSTTIRPMVNCRKHRLAARMVTAANSITNASDMTSPSNTQNPGYRAAITAAMTPARGVTRSLATTPVSAMVAVPMRQISTSWASVLFSPSRSPKVSSMVNIGGCWADGTSASRWCLAKKTKGSTNQWPSRFSCAWWW